MQRPLLLVPALVLVACSSRPVRVATGPESDDRASAIYAAVIRSVVTEGTNAAEVRVPVFVAPIDPEAPISLEVQAGVVEELHDFAHGALRRRRDGSDRRGRSRAARRRRRRPRRAGPHPRVAVTRVVVEAERYESENRDGEVRRPRHAVPARPGRRHSTRPLRATSSRAFTSRRRPCPVPERSRVRAADRRHRPDRAPADGPRRRRRSPAGLPREEFSTLRFRFFLTATSSFRYRGGCEPIEIVGRSRSEKSTGGTRHCQVLQCR